MTTPVVWFEILGQHGDSLQGFYAELLGWQFESRSGSPTVAAPRARSRRALLRRSARPAPAPPWWVPFSSRVPDLDAAIARARALGSRVLVPPTRHGDTVIAVVSDPRGHPVGLCT
jgi:predicted enzyme related to lactoylglutathione lyase